MPRRGEQTAFIAIDGEALETNEYALLAASTGETLTDREGISTVAAFEWLMALKAKYPHSVFVAFGLNYDVNMILRDMAKHPKKLETLRKKNSCEWLSPTGTFYRIEWIPQKMFRVCTGEPHNESFRGVTISDVFGFFQMSFVKALEDWQIPDVDGARARIVEGKAERGGFQWQDIEHVTRYCLAECTMLVALMEKLRTTFHNAGIRPQSWRGAGSAAGAVLKSQGVKKYHVRDDSLPKPLEDAVMRAYYGGRSEVFWQGEIGDCIGYDINSAYPAVTATLPTLKGEWKRVREYDSEARYALWLVDWDSGNSATVQPFPHRMRRDITYPVVGRGWYWQDEVRAATQLHRGAIRVRRGWVFEPATDAMPFAFVPEFFRLKAEAKAQGLAEAKAYKLALNSLYGKLAQGVGYRGDVPWQRSYVWAGMITSGTRARLLEMATAAPDDVVFMATDGIIFRNDPAFPQSDGLGGVERSEYPRLFVVQSGIYNAVEDGREVFRSRGFFKHEVSFASLREGWRQHGSSHFDVSSGRRFVGLGTAIARTDPPRWEIWRTWQDTPRRISMYPTRKFVDGDTEEAFFGGEPWPDAVRWISPHGVADKLSWPYQPKTTGMPADADPAFVQNMEQPYPDDTR